MNRTWIGTLILVFISGASASSLSKPECRPPEDVSDGTADGVSYLAAKDDCYQVDESSWEELQIFCHNGSQPTLASFWSSVTMKLKIDSDDYHIYLAPNVSMVQLAHKDFKASWFYSTMPWKSKDMKINPFQSSCMGVLARDKYTVRLHTYRVNYWQVGCQCVDFELCDFITLFISGLHDDRRSARIFLCISIVPQRVLPLLDRRNGRSSLLPSSHHILHPEKGNSIRKPLFWIIIGTGAVCTTN